MQRGYKVARMRFCRNIIHSPALPGHLSPVRGGYIHFRECYRWLFQNEKHRG